MRRTVLAVLSLLVLLAASAPTRSSAVPVTYEVDLGQFTSFQLSDQGGDSTDCQIGSQGNCLQQSISLTGTIVYDDELVRRRSRVIGYAIDARRQRFPDETPFVYQPFAGHEDDYRWDDRARADIKDYNIVDLFI